MTWHTINRVVENVYQISEPFGKIWPQWEGIRTVNMYLVVGQERAALIDSGTGIGDVHTAINKITSLPCIVLNSHYHWDHVGANSLFTETAIHEIEVDLLAQVTAHFQNKKNLAIYQETMNLPAARAVLPPFYDPGSFSISPGPATHILHDNELIDLGGLELRVLHIPGHSPGHVIF